VSGQRISKFQTYYSLSLILLHTLCLQADILLADSEQIPLLIGSYYWLKWRRRCDILVTNTPCLGKQN